MDEPEAEVVGRGTIPPMFEAAEGAIVPARPLDAMLDREGLVTRRPDGSPAPASALLASLACIRNGVDLRGDALPDAARLLGLEVPKLEAVIRFAEDLVDSTRVPGPMTLCRGINCTMRGCEALHPVLRESLRRAGGTRDVREVFCLNHCDSGPSVKVGRHVYCAGTNDVEVDRRTWNDGGGVVPIGDDSVPVLD